MQIKYCYRTPPKNGCSTKIKTILTLTDRCRDGAGEDSRIYSSTEVVTYTRFN